MGKNKADLNVVGVEGCKCQGCKKPQAQFTFCHDHYEWFKFGLITKEGKKVPDFDKKQDHFASYVAKQKQHKVA